MQRPEPPRQEPLFLVNSPGPDTAKRRIAEHRFMLGKRDPGLRRARIQVALTAMALNLQKLVRFTALPALAATALVVAGGRLWQHLRAFGACPPQCGLARYEAPPMIRRTLYSCAADVAF